MTVDWKRKNSGYGAVRYKDSHKKLFLEQTRQDFPETIVIPKEKITLSKKYSKIETRAQNLIVNETKGRSVNPISPATRHFNYID